MHRGLQRLCQPSFQKMLEWSAKQVTGNSFPSCYVADAGSLWFSSLFPALSILSFIDCWVKVNRSRSILRCPESLEKVSTHPALPFPVKGNFFELESFLFVVSNASLGDGVIKPKWSCSFFSVCVVILKVLFHCIGEVSEVDLRALPELFSFMHCCLLIFVGRWRL